MKKNKNTLIIILMFLLLLLIILSESSQKKINWAPSFSVKHKMPYGTYIAYNEAKSVLKKQLIDVRYSPYVFLTKNPEANGTFLLYNTSVELKETNLNKLLDWVEQGNNLMISSNRFDIELLDSLHLKKANYYNKKFDNTFQITLQNKSFEKDTAAVDKFSYLQYFKLTEKTNKYNPVVLGKIVDKEKDTLYNFLRLDFGKGHIYLHSFPYVFTNYFILKDQNYRYFEGILSYLNLKQPVYWDIHIQNGAGNKGIFKYIMQNEAFLWAYRLMFIGLLLYILFEGKRKQRPIPIVEPLRNETLQFTKTIADMYIENKENKNIALLHIKHFLDYVRTHLHLDARVLDNRLAKKISQKTGSEFDTVMDLFKKIDYIQQQVSIQSDDVLSLEELIEKVKIKR
jgi:hypothetical protein